MINTVTLTGRLGMDPELRTTDSGNSMVNFTLANHEYKMNNGSRQTITHWFNCVAFGPLAQLCSQFTHKGVRVGIVGQLRQRSWETKSGEKRNTIEIHVKEIEFLSPADKQTSKTNDSSDTKKK